MADKETEPNPIRAALIAPNVTVSEYSISLHHLLSGLTTESIPTALICPPDCDVDHLVTPAVEIIRHPAINLPFMQRWNRKILAEKLSKFNPTILHCLHENSTWLARQLSKQLNLPYVLTVDSLLKHIGPLSFSSGRLTKIVVPAESIADNLSKVCPRFSNIIEQISFGSFVSDSSECFSQTGRMASIIMAEDVKKTRDLQNFFNAIRHLAIDGYEFMLAIMDDGQGKKKLRNMLTEQGLLQRIVRVPKLQSWPMVLAAGDIFVRPRPNNYFNPLLLEAMSVGTAVAACKGGVDDLLIEDETCVIFNPDDTLSIYDTLKKLLDAHDLARKLARQAQEHIHENHSVSKMMDDILRIYRQGQSS